MKKLDLLNVGSQLLIKVDNAYYIDALLIVWVLGSILMFLGVGQ